MVKWHLYPHNMMHIVHLTVCQNHRMYLNDSIFRGAIIGTLHG